ncbi:MAG: Stp1/IreP family PP2C-type Ser/Thr phosphatase [Oscillospiraceae bacterium]|nr:Stp1/IreP family PP2C-type Ser/Thr phosphatase [Oscillospiraceae bacterium]
MRAWGLTDKGAVRSQNQDAYSIDIIRQNEQAVCVVCDGMGGARAGDVASELAVREFTDCLKNGLRQDMDSAAVASLMREAIDRANSEVFRCSLDNSEYFGMGTTLVATVITGSSAVVANVGDSRAYLITPQGAKRITRDHSVVEDMIQRGEITRDQARFHPVKNYITRAIGTEDRVICDVFKVEMLQGDYLLLCTDGLSNVVSDPEMLFEVIYCGEPDDCCERLMSIASARGAPDNVTVVLFQR